LGAQSCLRLSLRTSISKKLHLGPQNGPGSQNLLKIVNCQNGQKTVLSHLEKVGGHRYPPGSSKGALIQGEGATFEEVQWIDLSVSGTVQRFLSNPVERKGKAHLLPSSSLDSDGGIIWGTLFGHWECDTWGGHIRGSRAIISSDPGKSFRPISQ
jgi:hypothetical protein